MLDIFTHPTAAIFITISSYLLAQWVQKKCNNHSLLNPVVLAIFVVCAYILALDIPYKTYLHNVDLIHSLLGPATVALAIPLYKQLSLIKKSSLAIYATILISAFVAAGVGYFVARLIGADEELSKALLSKSVSTPIAIGIAEQIKADPALAVFFVFTTGILGSVIAIPLLTLCRITDARAIGLALGTTCHGLGVARAFQHSERAGAFSTLGMSLMGIISGILLPLLYLHLSG